MALACEVFNKQVESLGVLARLFVASAHRRQGGGGRLLQPLPQPATYEDLAPILDVGTHFKPAIALYEKKRLELVGSVTVAFRRCRLHEFVYVGPGQVETARQFSPRPD